MADYIDLTDEYYDTNKNANYKMRDSKLSDYDYANDIGSNGESYIYMGLYDADTYVWDSDEFTRDFYNKKFELIGRIGYQSVVGKDRRVMYPYKLEYYTDGAITEYFLYEYVPFAHMSLSYAYYRREDLAEDDPSTYAETKSLMPVLQEWFDGTIVQIEKPN